VNGNGNETALTHISSYGRNLASEVMRRQETVRAVHLSNGRFGCQAKGTRAVGRLNLQTAACAAISRWRCPLLVQIPGSYSSGKLAERMLDTGLGAGSVEELFSCCVGPAATVGRLRGGFLAFTGNGAVLLGAGGAETAATCERLSAGVSATSAVAAETLGAATTEAACALTDATTLGVPAAANDGPEVAILQQTVAAITNAIDSAAGTNHGRCLRRA
jgi:hypothetical protein